MKNTRFAWFLGIYTALMLCAPSFATDFALNPARDFGAIRRINPTDYDGYAVVRENGAGLSSGTAAAFRAALEVFSKAEAEPAGAVATHAGLTATHGATGAVVGTTNTQALTNKTLTDASNHISGSVIDSGTVADANIASTIARDSELASAMSAANASDALLLRLDGSRAMTGSLKFSGNYGILRNTSDGADTGSILGSGGGYTSGNLYDRGAAWILYGNEYTTIGGQARYYAGNVSTGDHIFYTGAGTERFRIAYDGTITAASNLKFSTSATISPNTDDGYDNKYITIEAGGPGRWGNGGGWAQFTGNEYDTNPGVLFLGCGNAASIRFCGAADAEKARMNANGNWLIGTTTDDGVNKLQVNGNVKLSGASAVSYIGTAGTKESRVYFDSSGNVVFGASSGSVYLRPQDYSSSANQFILGTSGAATRGGFTVWDAGSDGAGSGLDADYIDNRSSATFWGSDNDGSGSGLDADTVDTKHASDFVATSTYTAADVLTKIKTVDGSGSGLDADTVDGYAPSTSGTANTIVLRNADGGISCQTVSFGDMTGFSGYVDDTFRNGILIGTGNRLVYSTANGTLTNSSSDARMKRNVHTISRALNKVLSLRGVYYNWNASESRKLGSQLEMGMIAQEVEAVIPEVVGTNSTGMKSLDYPKLVAVLVEAVKELDKLRKSDNAALLRKIEKQEKRINELEAAFKAIQAKLH